MKRILLMVPLLLILAGTLLVVASGCHNGIPTVTFAPTPTYSPTPTATCNPVPVTFFEGANEQVCNWTASGTGVSVTSGSGTTYVQPTLLTSFMLLNPGYNGTQEAGGVSIVWNGGSENLVFRYNYAAAANWTSMVLSGFRGWVRTNPLPSDNPNNFPPGCFAFTLSGSSWVWAQNSWANFNAANTWQQVVFTGAASDPTSVEAFGFYIGCNGSVNQFANPVTGFAEISNVEMF